MSKTITVISNEKLPYFDDLIAPNEGGTTKLGCIAISIQHTEDFTDLKNQPTQRKVVVINEKEVAEYDEEGVATGNTVTEEFITYIDLYPKRFSMTDEELSTVEGLPFSVTKTVDFQTQMLLSVVNKEGETNPLLLPVYLTETEWKETILPTITL